MGFVYLICDAANETYKIGVTKGSIENRMKKLQTGNSTELFIKKHFQTKTPFYIEKCLHHHFADKLVNGEWYLLTVNDIGEFESYCQRCEEIVSAMRDNPFFKPK